MSAIVFASETAKRTMNDLLRRKLVFVNAKRANNRIGLFAAELINVIVKQEILIHAFWVERGLPQAKVRLVRISKVEWLRDNIMTVLRSPLQGNPERNEPPWSRTSP